VAPWCRTRHAEPVVAHQQEDEPRRAALDQRPDLRPGCLRDPGEAVSTSRTAVTPTACCGCATNTPASRSTRADRWKDEIENARRRAPTRRATRAFETLLEDLGREQIRPGVALVTAASSMATGGAALRRLWKESMNTARYRHFHAVILPGKHDP
jgi:hypothetical protein